MNVYDLLAEAARRWPERAALTRADGVVTYGDAERAARALAAALAAVGVGPGD